MSDSEASPTPSSRVAPEGVRGLLLLFVLSLIIFVPAGYVLFFLRSYGHIIAVHARLPHPYPHYVFYVVEQLASAALCGYGVFAGIQLWKARPDALVHAKRFLLLLVLYHLADFLTAVDFAWILDPPGTMSKYLPHALPRQLRHLIYPVVWYWYLLKSKRVRNTFYRDEAASNSHLMPV